MDWKAPELMVDPDDRKEPSLRRASYNGVVRHVPPDLRGFDPLWVVQRLLHLSANNPALGMIPLQVPGIRRVPGHWPVVHPYTEYIPHIDQSPYGGSIQRTCGLPTATRSHGLPCVEPRTNTLAGGRLLPRRLLPRQPGPAVIDVSMRGLYEHPRQRSRRRLPWPAMIWRFAPSLRRRRESNPR